MRSPDNEGTVSQLAMSCYQNQVSNTGNGLHSVEFLAKGVTQNPQRTQAVSKKLKSFDF